MALHLFGWDILECLTTLETHDSMEIIDVDEPSPTVMHEPGLIHHEDSDENGETTSTRRQKRIRSHGSALGTDEPIVAYRNRKLGPKLRFS